jgi:hypothetical protein
MKVKSLGQPSAPKRKTQASKPNHGPVLIDPADPMWAAYLTSRLKRYSKQFRPKSSLLQNDDASGAETDEPVLGSRGALQLTNLF